LPIELEKAAASAETPGPVRDECSVGPPASGVNESPAVPAWPDTGICRSVGVPDKWLEGTGDASRAVEVARGAEVPSRDDPGDVPSRGLEAEWSIVADAADG
jgi:hypothetical protein